MRRLILFSSFVLVLIGTLGSFAQNPPQKPETAPVQGEPQAPSENFAPSEIGSPDMGMPREGSNNLPNQQGDLAPLSPESEPAVTSGSDDSSIPQFQNPEGYHYDPTGRRDPFKPYGESQSIQAQPTNRDPEEPKPVVEPLQAFDIAEFKLLGIIWQVKDPKAMVLDPNGKTHLIRKQTKIGRNNGFVAAIREGEVIVVEPTVGENGAPAALTRVMNLMK